jgi:ABC-type transport system involved in multi-copper enzyme maturation permease subunit
VSAALLALDLRRARTQLVAYAVVTAIYGVAVAAIYPTVIETAELFEPYLDMVPPGILEAFEMGGGITSPGAYFGSQFFQVWVIIAAMLAIGLGTRGTAAETAAGTIETPLSAPLSRTHYLLTTIVTQALALALLAGVAVVSVVALGPLIDVAFDVPAFAAVGVLSFAFGCAMAGVTTLVSVITLDRGRSIGFGAIVLILMYLATVVAGLESSVENLRYVSAFNYYHPGAVIDQGQSPAGETLLFLAVAIATWGLAVWRFRTRDLVA